MDQTILTVIIKLQASILIINFMYYLVNDIYMTVFYQKL